jgi:hypothetical protein
MNRNSPLRYLAFATPIVVAVLGIWVAVITANRYEAIVRGILGLAVCYFIYELYMSPRSLLGRQSLEMLFEFPKNVRFYIFTFTVSLIWYWALRQIGEMVFFLLG